MNATTATFMEHSCLAGIVGTDHAGRAAGLASLGAVRDPQWSHDLRVIGFHKMNLPETSDPFPQIISTSIGQNTDASELDRTDFPP
jgi:hypothetical protein